MITTIIVAIIGALATVTGAVSAAYIQKKRGAAEVEAQTRRTSESIDKERYLYRIGTVRNSARLLNTDGDAILERRYVGIKINPALNALSEMPGSTMTSGEFDTLPHITEHSDIHRGVLIEHRNVSSGRCDWAICVVGGLTHADRELDVTIESRVTKSFVMKKDEVAARYKDDLFKNEYLALNVDVPVDRIELEVDFPEGFSAEAFGAAFYPGTERIMVEESTRIKDLVTRDENRVRLTVDGPLIPYRYVLYWIMK